MRLQGCPRVCCKPFGTATSSGGQQLSAIVVVKPCGLLRPSRAQRLACNALESNWGSQQSSVTSPGSDAAVMPFEITNRKDDPQLIAGASTEPTAAAVSETPKSGSASWESWLKIFEKMDQAFEQQEQLKLQLKDAVRHEEYSRAAAVKQQLSAVQQQDEVAAVQAGLLQALQQERYDEAARLRDQGMAWMQGWWCGISEGDPVGHLMHTTPEFGRYTGRVYTARDLADLAGLRDGSSGGGLQQLRSAMQADSSALRGTGTVGSPALEVFVIRQDGELVHQVVSLMGAAPTATTRAADRNGGLSSSMGGGLGGGEEVAGSLASMFGIGPLMRLSVVVHPDGGATLRAIPLDGAGEDAGSRAGTGRRGEEKRDNKPGKLVGWDAVEAEETMRALAMDGAGERVLPPGVGEQTGAASASVEEDGEVAEALRALVEEAPVEVEVVSVVSVEEERLESVGGQDDERLSTSEQALVAEVLDSLRGGATAGEPAGAEDADQMVVDVQAARAVEIDATGPDEGSGSEGEDEGGSGAGGSGEAGSGLFTELHRSSAELQRLSVDQFVLRLPQDVAGARPAGASDQQAVRFEILVPAGQLTRGGGRTASAVAAVAERVARAQARQARRPVDAFALRAALQAVLKSLEAGKPADIVIPSADSRTGVAGPGTSGAPAVRYTRVPAETGPKSDPFSGLYVGSFGPHGPELLRLTRLMVDGEEMVEATKLTGDPNVPAGTVSFRAKIGRKHKQSASQVYPDELAVTARYKGQGRVAAKGYSRPKWVEGELLVFSSSSALTSGAQLGFVWHVPGERKFLILLNKVDLQGITANIPVAM